MSARIPPIRVTALGASGAGKYVQLLGMYNALQSPVRGYGLTLYDDDEAQRLRDRWANLTNTNRGEDRWPPPVSFSSTDYVFKFQYYANLIADVDWNDYRGGALYGTSASPDTTKLRANARQSSCFCLYLDGTLLAKGLMAQGARNASMPQMNAMLADWIQANTPTAQRPLPVALIVTKYDACMAAHRGWDDILGDLKTYANSLFIPGSHVLTAVIPVSLGAKLATNPERAPIQPLNMHLPIFFAAWAQLGAAFQEKRQALARMGNDAAGRAAHSALNMEIVALELHWRLLGKELEMSSIYREGAQVDASKL